MKKLHKTFFSFGTTNTITVFFNEGEEEAVYQAVEKGKKDMLYLDDLLSVFKEDSDVHRINAAAGKQEVNVSEETFLIVKEAVEFAQKSGGLFDITSRPISSLWSIGKKEDYIPPIPKIKWVQRLVNYKDIKFQQHPYKIGLRRKGQEIDLGGIAKGYAADRAYWILKDYGVKEAIINFGGTIRTIGKVTQVGIQDPRKRTGTAMGRLKVKEKAVVTSGVYERYFIKNGVRYHHIMDPRTGMPAKSDICGITVIGDSAMEMDALATSVLLLGMEKGAELLKQFQSEGIFITNSNEVFLTQGIGSHFNLI